jgi:hypothetical protein
MHAVADLICDLHEGPRMCKSAQWNEAGLVAVVPISQSQVECFSLIFFKQIVSIGRLWKQAYIE